MGTPLPATAVCTVPAVAGGTNSPEPMDFSRTAGRAPRILVVDDDPFALNVHVHLLRRLGLDQVTAVESAREAVALLAAAADPAIDIVLCDLRMPDMDGIDFLHHLRDQCFSGSVIVLSGVGARVLQSMQKLLKGGPPVLLGVIEKPADPASVRDLIDGWRPFRPPQPQRTPTISLTPADLHAANLHGHWQLHYQPIVKLDSAELVCVEALVRLNHPEHGLIYPDNFIELAESCGAIGSMTNWVLQKAMEDMMQWEADLGLDISIAINLSMEVLHDVELTRRLCSLAGVRGTSRRRIDLEVTESRLLGPHPAPLENLVRLRMQGFELSIDDFGTGHSSLAQLRDIPFTKLKVDKSFVRDARHNPVVRPILEGSIGIAKRLGMQSVAEGVESEDDWRLLRQIGCDLCQGYFIARPFPPSEMRLWRDRWATRQARLAAM